MVQQIKNAAKKSLDVILAPPRWMDTHVYGPIVGKLPANIRAKVPVAGSAPRLVADSAVTYGVSGLAVWEIFSKTATIGWSIVPYADKLDKVAPYVLGTLGVAGLAASGAYFIGSRRARTAIVGAAFSAAVIAGGVIAYSRAHQTSEVAVVTPKATATANPAATATPYVLVGPLGATGPLGPQTSSPSTIANAASPTPAPTVAASPAAAATAAPTTTAIAAPTATATATAQPSPTPKQYVAPEINYSIPSSLYATVGNNGASNLATLASAMNARAVDYVGTSSAGLVDMLNASSRVEFSDTANEARIYISTKPVKPAAVVRFSEEGLDSIVANAVLKIFKPVAFLDRKDYAALLADGKKGREFAATLVDIPIVDRKGQVFVNHDPADILGFLRQNVGSYGDAELQFGRADGKIRLNYEGSQDGVPFQTVNTTPVQQQRTFDAVFNR